MKKRLITSVAYPVPNIGTLLFQVLNQIFRVKYLESVTKTDLDIFTWRNTRDNLSYHHGDHIFQGLEVEHRGE
jgi:hypothetical protein